MVSYYFSLFDKVAKDYGQLFCARNDEDAIRQTDISFKQNIEKYKYFSASDFKLYRVLELNINNGEINVFSDVSEIKDYANFDDKEEL